jgi:hypothetical protein
MRKIAVASAINFENLKMQIRTRPPCSFYSYKKDCPGSVSVSVPMNVVNVAMLLELVATDSPGVSTRAQLIRSSRRKQARERFVRKAFRLTGALMF